jgi:hypothetical protein
MRIMRIDANHANKIDNANHANKKRVGRKLIVLFLLDWENVYMNLV